MTAPYLPTELIELIATNLDLRSFLSLRLTSHELSKQTAHYLRTRYLCTQTLSWTRESLDTFLEKNTHETFSGALQNLVVDATPYHSQTVWRASKQSPEDHADPAWPHTDSTEQDARLDAARTAATAANKFFNETRYDVKILSAVFARLRTLDTLTFAYAHMERSYAKFSMRYCVSSQHEMSRPFVSTMAAVAATGLEVSAINEDAARSYGAVGVGRLESLAPVLGKFDAAFAKLTTLHLRLRDWRCPDEGFALEESAVRAPFVVRFLAKARQLRELSLDCYSDFEDDIFGHMAGCCVFPKLEMCHLVMLPINVHNPHDLHTFLAPCADSLTHLSLKYLLLPGGGEEPAWPELLVDLARSETVLKVLESLRLDSLFAAKGASMWFGSNPCQLGSHVHTWREYILCGSMYESVGSKAMWESMVAAYPWGRI